MADDLIDPARFGMPTADTAGVQAGVTLTPYTGSMTIATDGVVIENKIINGTLRVTGDNVTIKNCVFQNYGWFGVDCDGAANTTIQNCDFTASSSMDTSSAILGSGTFIGNDISNSENGISLTAGASIVRDNYIHDLGDNFGDPHIDGISVQGGQNHVLIEHNTIESWDTSCIFIKNDFGPINDIMVRNNLLYSDEEPSKPEASMTVYVWGPNTTNVSIIDNYIEHGLYDYFNIDRGATPVLSGNVLWREGIDPTPYPDDPPPPTDHFPDAVNDSVNTAHNTAVTVNALANDNLGDTPTGVSAFDASTANGGVVSHQGGAFTYTPATGWSGTDTFNYTILDVDGDADSATVSVAVAPPSPPPPPTTITGTNGNNTLNGTAGPDLIRGLGGSDTLRGNAGNDRLIGGAHNDQLFGGSGADVFAYETISDSLPNVGRRDLIWDWETGDKIDLSVIDARQGVSGNQAFTFMGEGAFGSTSTSGLVKFRYDSGADRTLIEGTVNTSSGIDFQISLVGQHALTANDFVL